MVSSVADIQKAVGRADASRRIQLTFSTALTVTNRSHIGSIKSKHLHAMISRMYGLARRNSRRMECNGDSDCLIRFFSFFSFLSFSFYFVFITFLLRFLTIHAASRQA
jgi:hypothetical protein